MSQSLIVEKEESRQNSILQARKAKTVNDLVRISKRLFSKYFGLNYQFTYEELGRELENKKMLTPEQKRRIDLFVKKLNLVEYAGKEEKFVILRRDFLDLVNSLSPVRKATISGLIKKKIKKIYRSIALKIKVLEMKITLSLIKNLLTAEEKSLDKAKELYVDLHKKYDGLKEMDKKRAYPIVMSAYKDIKKTHDIVAKKKSELSSQ